MSWLQRYQNLDDPLRTERRVEFAVVVLLALLLLQLLWGAYRAIFPSLPDPVRPTAEALEVRSLRAADAVSPEMRAEIRHRPLFWAARRPTGSGSEAELAAAEAARAAQESKPGKIDGVKLAGVFGAGESAGIIVIAKDKKHRVMVNQQINGWTLQSITPTQALFASDGKEATLALKRGTIVVTEVTPAEVNETPVKEEAGKEEPGKAEKVPKQDKTNEQAPARGVKNNGDANKKNAGKKPPPGEDSLTLGRRARPKK